MKKNKHEIIFGREARDKILEGIEIVYKAVGTTLGPRGNNVVIDRGFEPSVIHDGYEVAKAITVTDKYKKLGADILLQAVKKQVDEVGDGTTLVTILGRNIAVEANRIIAAGVNAMELREGLERWRDALIEQINSEAQKIKTVEKKIQIAIISSASEELGKMIGETIDKIGEDGISTVEESNSHDTLVEMQDGFQIDQGWRVPLFITNPQDQTAVLEGARVLITDKVLSDFVELQNFLANELIPHGKTLFVMAQDFEGNVIPSFVVNKMNGKMNVLCVQAPLFENIQKAFLYDVAALTGATVISEDSGIKLNDVKLEHLGYAQKIVATKDATIIRGGKGNKKEIKTRIKAITNEIAQEDSAYEIAKLRERIGRLVGSVAVIKVGGATPVEMNERKERVKDAVEATRTAVKTGIVPGGEVTLLNLVEYINLKGGTDNAAEIMKNALKAPFKKLLTNAGIDPGEYIERLRGQGKQMGVNVADGKIYDLVKEGIVDPAGVLTSAIINAVSVAIQAMTIDAIIPHETEEK